MNQENLLISILVDDLSIARYYRDRLSVELCQDYDNKLILNDILNNISDPQFNKFNLFECYGNKIDQVYGINKIDYITTAELLIADLEKKLNLKNAYNASLSFISDCDQNKNPSLTTFLSRLSEYARDNAGNNVLYSSEDWLNTFQTLANKQEDRPKLRTIYGEFVEGSVVYLSGRPGMWKSTAAINIMYEHCKRDHVLMVSLEMQKESIFNIMTQIATGVHSSKARSQGFTHEELETFAKEIHTRKNKIHISDNPNCTTANIERMILNLTVREQKPKMVIVDNLNLIQKHTHNEYEALSAITRELKVIAMKYNIVLICIAHVNRGSTERKDKKPTLSNLRGSGTIEADADYVVFLHRPQYYYDEKGECTPPALVNKLFWYQAKNRHDQQLNGYREINLSIGKDVRELSGVEISDYLKADKVNDSPFG